MLFFTSGATTLRLGRTQVDENERMVKQKIKRVIKGMNVVYLLITLLFILDSFQLLEIKSALIKLFVHFGALFSMPIVLITNILIKLPKKWLISVIVAAVLMCATVALTVRGPMGFVFSLSEWNTQTVLYEHKFQPNRTIERQMRDVGALGYRERIVEVFYITPWFMITKEIDEESIPSQSFWTESGEYVNELELLVE